MTPFSNDKIPPETSPRDALAESEKRASPQPGTYRERENAEKEVGVKPVDADSVPIQGLDPDR